MILSIDTYDLTWSFLNDLFQLSPTSRNMEAATFDHLDTWGLGAGCGKNSVVQCPVM